MKTRKQIPTVMVSRVLPLKKAAEALALACAKTGVVKVQIDLT